MELATGEFITSQDSDDYSAPDRIQHQLEHALSHDLDGASLRVSQVGLDGKILDLYTGYPELRPPSGVQPVVEKNRYASTNVPSEGRVLYRTELAARLGGFDGHRRVEGDTDFAGRFARVFTTGAYNEKPLYYWVRREGSLTTSTETGYGARKWYLRNRRQASPQRKEAVRAKRASIKAANFYFRHGLVRRFTKEIRRDLYYPEGLTIERYTGPGVPVGRFHGFDPMSEDNDRWWNERVTELPWSGLAKVCAKALGKF
jgi:hypothetical protein